MNMPNNEDIKILFEEGELINKYLESQRKGIQEVQPVLFIVDSDEDAVEEDLQKGYVSCDSCSQEIMNYCTKCGTLDIDTRRTHLWCSHCVFKFSPEELLKEHKSKCQVKPTLKINHVICPFCKKKKDCRSLYSHLKACAVKNSGSAQETTIPISIKYNVQDLYSYKCLICNMDFDNQAAYNSHILNNHKTKSSFKCPFCAQVTISDETLLTHIRRAHSLQRYMRPILPKPILPKPNFAITSTDEVLVVID